jgi:hypothetical protein
LTIARENLGADRKGEATVRIAVDHHRMRAFRRDDEPRPLRRRQLGDGIEVDMRVVEAVEVCRHGVESAGQSACQPAASVGRAVAAGSAA